MNEGAIRTSLVYTSNGDGFRGDGGLFWEKRSRLDRRGVVGRRGQLSARVFVLGPKRERFVLQIRVVQRLLDRLENGIDTGVKRRFRVWVRCEKRIQTRQASLDVFGVPRLGGTLIRGLDRSDDLIVDGDVYRAHALSIGQEDLQA
jgi:hypothetical protein